MFDYIIIDSKKLPLSAPEQELLKNKVYQTKSLESCLLSYKITNEDELVLLNIKEEKTSALIPYTINMDDEEYIEAKNIVEEKIPFHGFITFYTSINKLWYEFKTKFTDDKLVSIERILNTN